MLKIMTRPVCMLLVLSFILLDFSVQTSQARMVDTNTVIMAEKGEANRQRVDAFLGREDVQKIMMMHGVNAAEAHSRVAALSDAEVEKISSNIDRLPAGGDAVGSVVGAAVFIFVVLLVTDLLGLTHVFSFVNHPR